MVGTWKGLTAVSVGTKFGSPKQLQACHGCDAINNLNLGSLRPFNSSNYSRKDPKVPYLDILLNLVSGYHKSTAVAGTAVEWVYEVIS